jgi:hypothetical protein
LPSIIPPCRLFHLFSCRFNDGGIGVDFQPGSERAEFIPPAELSMPGCSGRLMGDKPSRAIVGRVLLEMEPQYSGAFHQGLSLLVDLCQSG